MARSTRLVILIKNIYFMVSETLPSTCCILSDESSIPFYPTSNGYNNKDPTKAPLLATSSSFCREYVKHQKKVIVECLDFQIFLYNPHRLAVLAIQILFYFDSHKFIINSAIVTIITTS